MRRPLFLGAFAALCGFALLSQAQHLTLNDADSLTTPPVGAFGLRILSSNLVELRLITTKAPDPAPVQEWNFVTPAGLLNLPGPTNFEATIGDHIVGVSVIGFKRRPLYAPLKERDLRIANQLYMQLHEPIADGETVRIRNPGENLFDPEQEFIAVKDPHRRTPAIHVNQAGYPPGLPKKATVGFYLGSAAEMPVPAHTPFLIVSTTTSNAVFQGELTLRPDTGYTFTPVPYQAVLEADFTTVDTPGEYWLQVPDLGVSFPFRIHDGSMATVARTYALGLYHQRCGSGNELPFTRHTHALCHSAPAEVPTTNFSAVNQFLAEQTADYTNEVRHIAPPLTNVNASLYPFINTNNIDVSGGHHDAGDYSKYTINSAQLIHALIFAVDTMPTVRALDNLGLPESGDGISDVLQIAKREADFLAKMQDADGGFYFLVYPRDRRYEHDVLPDHGDSQVVYPKNTTATAAGVAALAQMASSPAFHELFPAEASLYLQKATNGWAFLERALAMHGRDGAYQKVTHYGSAFIHDDELAWAATELFLATGDSRYHNELLTHFDPADPNTRLWTWWRLFEGYGCAVRSYAFAAATGRRSEAALDATYLTKCRAEIMAAAEDQLSFSQMNAYGVSFPLPSKQFRVAGWFFPINQAFDLVAAYQLDPKPAYLDAILANINYECGSNPENVSFLTGIGRKRQREIVHQYAQNDRRILPSSGFPLGAIQSGFQYLEPYKGELGALTFPSDGDPNSAYAPYDRWADSFNVTTEFVSAQQARALAVAAFVWQLPSPDSAPWRSAHASISDLPAEITVNQTATLSLRSSEVDLNEAMITWEAQDQEPFIGSTFTLIPTNPGPHWIEAEALLPDGRRVFAAADIIVRFGDHLPANSYQSNALPVRPELAALYHLDFEREDATGKQSAAGLTGNARLDDVNVGWMAERTGAALRFDGIGDSASMEIANNTLFDASTEAIVLEVMIYISRYHSPTSNIPLATLQRNWNASLELLQNRYFGPTFRGGIQFELSGASVSNALPRNVWNHLRLAIGKTGYSLRINGKLFAFIPSNDLTNWDASQGVSTLTVGNFEGWVDEIAVWNVKTNHAMTIAASQESREELKLEVSGNSNVHYFLQNSLDLLNWNTLSTNFMSSSSSTFRIPINSERKFFKATSIP